MTRIQNPRSVTAGFLGKETFSCYNSQRLRRRQNKPKLSLQRMVLLFCLFGFTTTIATELWLLSKLSLDKGSDLSISNTVYGIDTYGFPHHVENDMEQIPHPGFLLSDQQRLEALYNNMGIPQNVSVPKFWEPEATYQNGMDGRASTWYGSSYEGEETIFVAIASYRDEKCTSTVEDIFERAKHPERLRVAIVDQLVPGVDQRCAVPEKTCADDKNSILCKFRHLIDRIEYDAQLMVGPTFARHITNRMYRGESFALQIDSHVRFVADWDVEIVSQWKSLRNQNGVISTYLNNYLSTSIDSVTHMSRQDRRSMMCNADFGWPGTSNEHIKFSVQPSSKPRFKDVPMLQPFWAAGFSFSRGAFIFEVPYDPYLPMVFQGEEISMTIRGFTHGFDFYAPSKNVAFHIYPTKDTSPNPPKVFTENEVLFPGSKSKAYHRLNGILGINKSQAPFFDLETKHYGLGEVRSADLFFDLFGINWKKSVTTKGLCNFVQGIGVLSMHEVFTPHIRLDGMGIDYSETISVPAF